MVKSSFTLSIRLIIPSFIAQYILKLSFSTWKYTYQQGQREVIFSITYSSTKSLYGNKRRHHTYQSQGILYYVISNSCSFGLQSQNISSIYDSRLKQYKIQTIHKKKKRRIKVTKSTRQPIRRYRSCCKAGNCSKSSSLSNSLVLL